MPCWRVHGGICDLPLWIGWMGADLFSPGVPSIDTVHDGLYHNILVLTGHWLISRAILIIVCSVVDQSLAQCNTWWVFVNLIIFIGLQLDVAIDDSIQQCTRIVLPYLYDTAFCNMLVLVNISDISGWIYIIPNVALHHNIYTFSRVWPIVYTVLPVTELYLRYYSVVWNCLYLTLILNAHVQFEKKIHRARQALTVTSDMGYS